MEQFLLKNTKSEYKYCYFQNDEQDVYNIFVVKFSMGADNYDRLYWWGRNEDKHFISQFPTLVYSPDNDENNEWRMIDLEKKHNIGNFDKIVQEALKEVESLKKSIKQ